MSMTTVRALGRRAAVLPACALAVATLAGAASAQAAATTAAPLAVASATPRSSLAVTLAGNSPILTPGGDPAEFVATIVNAAPRSYSGVRVSFSTVPADPAAHTHWYGDGDLRLEVAGHDGWEAVALAPTAARTAFHGTLSSATGLTLPAGAERQLRFRLALTTSASGVVEPSEFTVEAAVADGSVHSEASRDYAVRVDPAATPVGERVTISASAWPRPLHHHHHLARASAVTGTIATVVSIAAVFGLGAIAFGLGAHRRRRHEH